ncbi:MAG: hypothetical protein EXR77_05205 [Myxococcales bacterium]|nr:hypothetical protein [Myxococcales bacterium]
MKMRLSFVSARAVFAVACSLAFGACTASSSGGGSSSGAGTADAVDSAGGKADVVVLDTGAKTDVVVGDTAAPADAADAAPTGNAACCLQKKAKCGFVTGCSGSCGGCPIGEKCDAATGSATVNTCVKSAPAKALKKNGESCGPNADCVVPGNNASDQEKSVYSQCLNDQCTDGRCYLGVCSKFCKIATDKKDNATGAEVANGDGIEDPEAVSECSDFVDGPAGKDFKCVNLFSPSDPQQVAICTPGTSFIQCKNNADCKNGEVCGYKQIRGKLAPVCGPAYKNVDGKPGTTLGNICNNNPKAGPLSTCKNNLCLGIGCADFCKDDNDCITEAGACQAGKCASGGKSCANDADCSAWMCKKDQAFFGKDQPTVNVCLPKPCYLDEDCNNPNYYCLSGYNGVDNQEGDPDPKDPTKIKLPGWDESSCVKKAPNTAKKGEACDDYPNDDDVTLKPCENKYWCQNGTCGNHCKTNAQCAANMKCGIVEIPLDTSDPQDKKYDVYTALSVCTPMPGATKDCMGQGDCKGEATAKFCRHWELPLPNAGTETGASKYTIGGLCIAPEAGFGDVGAQCGLSNGKNCKSGLCFGQQDAAGKTSPGWCTDLCSSKADCPPSITFTGYNNQQAKAYCSSIFWSHNASAQPLDNLYLPVCLPDTANSSLQDCSSDFKCAAAGEACVALGIGTGPDKPATTDFRCRSLKNAATDPVPTKKVGELCNPNPAQSDPEECASGLCMPDSTTGKGYCSALCKDNAVCGSNDSLFCDVAKMILPRADTKMAAKAPMCIKKKSCIPCAYDYQCATGNLCAWTDTKAENGRCAPPCETDADCAKTDGGGKCEDQKGLTGKPTGKKLCTPTACK